MAKKQTRRTFSVSRSTYDAAMHAAAAAGVSCSEWVTELIRERVPDLLPKQTHMRPDGNIARPVRLDLITGDSFDRGEVAHVAPQSRSLPARAELDEMAAKRKLAAADIPPGTLCANCVEAPATHRGRIDLSGQTYALCDDCELPDETDSRSESHLQRRGGLA